MKPPLELSSVVRSRSLVWAEWLVLGSLFTLCLAVALTQAVNPFPEDGWFASQYSLFHRAPGADNYTPIAAPAYLYFAIHVLANFLGLGLEGEFYLGCLVQNLAVFLVGVCLCRAHRLLGFGNIGLLVSALVVLFIQSTLMAQAFWSENAILLLMSITLLCSVRIAFPVDDNRRSLLAWSLALGLTLGLSVITRVVPIVLVPGLAWLFHRQLDRPRARLASTTVAVCVLAVVLGAMSANLWRFDRFELSNSAGRHLWQNISPWADEMLANSAEYQLLKRADPAIAGKKWWEVPDGKVPGLEHLSREEMLRLLSWQAITSHPVRYLRTGIENTALLPRDPPWRLGAWKGPNYNPLHRDSMLPPLLGPLPALEGGLKRIFYACRAVWPLVAYGVLLGWMFTALIRRWNRLQLGSEMGAPRPDGVTMPGNDHDPTATLRGFLAFALIVPLWVSCQIEVVDFRYLLPYLPVLALLMTTTLCYWAQFTRKLDPIPFQ